MTSDNVIGTGVSKVNGFLVALVFDFMAKTSNVI